MKDLFKSIIAICYFVTLLPISAFAQNPVEVKSSLTQPTTDAVTGKEFIRFSAYPTADRKDRLLIVEICKPVSRNMVCTPMGNGYYSLSDVKKIAHDSMVKAHVSGGALAGVVALAAVLALPVASGIVLTGMIVIGTTGVTGAFVLATGLAATTLYFLGANFKTAVGVGAVPGVLTAIGMVTNGLLATLTLGSPFVYSFVLPFAAGWKALDTYGLNPIKNYSRGFALSEIYKQASESGSTEQIEIVQKILETLQPVAPFNDPSLIQRSVVAP